MEVNLKKHKGKSALSPRSGRSPQTVQLKHIKRQTAVPRPAPKKNRRGNARDGLEESMYLEQSEIQALFRVITSKRDNAIFRVAYHRGLRAHEVGLLQLADFKGEELFVHRGKGSRSKHHTLTSIEGHALRMWIKERGRIAGPLFPSRNHKPITRTRLDQLMKKYCALAGIAREKAHMHALKHSCGTHLAERGNPADGIKDWLGHKDLKSTDIYMHFTSRRRSEMALRNRDWK